MPIDKTDILDMYDNLKRNYENVKDRWAIKERIREEETQMEEKQMEEKPELNYFLSHVDNKDLDEMLTIMNHSYDTGFIDGLAWVIRDEVDHAIREEN